jgi:hypothetical protein
MMMGIRPVGECMEIRPVGEFEDGDYVNRATGLGSQLNTRSQSGSQKDPDQPCYEPYSVKYLLQPLIETNMLKAVVRDDCLIRENPVADAIFKATTAASLLLSSPSYQPSLLAAPDNGKNAVKGPPLLKLSKNAKAEIRAERAASAIQFLEQQNSCWWWEAIIMVFLLPFMALMSIPLHTANGMLQWLCHSSAGSKNKWLMRLVFVLTFSSAAATSTLSTNTVQGPDSGSSSRSVPPSTVAMVRRQLTTEVANWNGLIGACADMSDGTIALGDDFIMSPYGAQCVFTNKKIVVECHGKTLDMAGNGWHFFEAGVYGTCTSSSTSLTLRGCTLKNGGKLKVSVFLCRAVRRAPSAMFLCSHFPCPLTVGRRHLQQMRLSDYQQLHI